MRIHSKFFVNIKKTSKKTILGCLGTNSGLGAKDLRLRFIIYQLLQTIAYIHSQEQQLSVPSLRPDSIMLDDDMWVYFPVDITFSGSNNNSTPEEGVCSDSSTKAEEKTLGAQQTTEFLKTNERGKSAYCRFYLYLNHIMTQY